MNIVVIYMFQKESLQVILALPNLIEHRYHTFMLNVHVDELLVFPL